MVDGIILYGFCFCLTICVLIFLQLLCESLAQYNMMRSYSKSVLCHVEKLPSCLRYIFATWTFKAICLIFPQPPHLQMTPSPHDIMEGPRSDWIMFQTCRINLVVIVKFNVISLR